MGGIFSRSVDTLRSFFLEKKPSLWGFLGETEIVDNLNFNHYNGIRKLGKYL